MSGRQVAAANWLCFFVAVTTSLAFLAAAGAFPANDPVYLALTEALGLDGFAGKVTRKLENTLGVFLAVNGFSADAVAAHSRARPSVVLMDGADPMAVLEERIDFGTLLLRKKQHASRTGNIYLRVHEMSQ